jgi:hypothetical protein
VEVGRAATSVLVAALSVGVAEVVVLNLTAEPGLQAWGLDTATSAFQAGAGNNGTVTSASVSAHLTMNGSHIPLTTHTSH